MSASIRGSRVLEARGLVRRAISRGEPGPSASPTLILDTLLGANLNHVLATPDELRPAMTERSPQYLDDLTAFILTAAGAIYPASPDAPPGRRR
jgi:hypothetical protein